MAANDGDLTETDAIRQVIADGAGGDYTDIAAAVRRRFGLIVGSRLVEEVVLALREEAAQSPRESSAHSAAVPANQSGDLRNRVLAFVHEMGGFAEARAAIDELESEMRRLLP